MTFLLLEASIVGSKYMHCGPSMTSQWQTPWKDLFTTSEGTFQVKDIWKDTSGAIKKPWGLSKGTFIGTSLTVHSVPKWRGALLSLSRYICFFDRLPFVHMIIKKIISYLSNVTDASISLIFFSLFCNESFYLLLLDLHCRQRKFLVL